MHIVPKTGAQSFRLVRFTGFLCEILKQEDESQRQPDILGCQMLHVGHDQLHAKDQHDAVASGNGCAPA